MRPALALPMSLLLASPALSEEAQTGVSPLALTYEVFEAAVDHLDLASCPAEVAAPGRFCRLTAHRDSLNVFAFSEDGDQPLVAIRSYPTDLLAALSD